MPSSANAGAPFGHTSNGRSARLYTLQNTQLRVAITDYGGRIVSLEMSGRDGRWHHVVLGFYTAEAYERSVEASFGALLGRTSNRIGGSRFTLGGATYNLSRNQRGGTLHGGEAGFDKIYWQVAEAEADHVSLALTSRTATRAIPGSCGLAPSIGSMPARCGSTSPRRRRRQRR